MDLIYKRTLSFHLVSYTLILFLPLRSFLNLSISSIHSTASFLLFPSIISSAFNFFSTCVKIMFLLLFYIYPTSCFFLPFSNILVSPPHFYLAFTIWLLYFLFLLDTAGFSYSQFYTLHYILTPSVIYPLIHYPNISLNQTINWSIWRVILHISMEHPCFGTPPFLHASRLSPQTCK